MKPQTTPRKVFVSFLGGTNYSECRYALDEYTSAPVRYIQEAMLDMLSSTGQWSADDIAIILLTPGAEKANWLDNGHRNRETNEPIIQQGLQSRLAELHPPMRIVTIHNLPNGNNGDEIVEIFQCLYQQLRQGDQLYFDITHGFRYLPMLFMALGRYAKTLLGCEVCNMSYGNYEMRDKDTNTARIIDLSQLMAMQEWSAAADAFVRHGDISDLSNLSKAQLRPILREAKGANKAAITLNKTMTMLDDTIADMRTCRGINIVTSSNISNLQKQLDELDEVIIPTLRPVISHVESAINVFEPRTCVDNGFAAAEWCAKHGLIQQAVTILFENVVTFFCMKYSLKWTTESERDKVNKAINFSMDKTPEEEWRFAKKQDTPERREMIRTLMRDAKLSAMINVLIKMRDIRNDFNHSGMRENAMSARTITDKFMVVMSEIMQQLSTRIFVNLSNHPSSEWPAPQLHAAKAYGEIIDMPFPQVSPNASHDEISKMAQQTVDRLPANGSLTVHVMGEMTLTYAIVELCKSRRICCVASTTERIVNNDVDGVKTSTFRFVEFRKY